MELLHRHTETDPAVALDRAVVDDRVDVRVERKWAQ